MGTNSSSPAGVHSCICSRSTISPPDSKPYADVACASDISDASSSEEVDDSERTITPLFLRGGLSYAGYVATIECGDDGNDFYRAVFYAMVEACVEKLTLLLIALSSMYTIVFTV